MKNKNILVAAGGSEFMGPPPLSWSQIIAADSGGDFLFRENLPAHILIGDFDSISPEGLRFHETHGARIIRYSREKDFTDLELGLQSILPEKSTRIHVLGLFGGQWDHEFMNLLLLAKYCEDRLFTFDFRDGCGGMFGSGKLTVEHRQPGRRASLLALSPEVSGIHSAGVKWELQDETLKFGESRGLSNETTNQVWHVAAGKGTLLWTMAGVSHAEIEIEWLPESSDRPEPRE